MPDLQDYEAINRGFGRIVQINEAIAAAIFSEDAAGLPVYLDLEEDALERIAQSLGIPVAEAANEIVGAVKATIAGTPSKKNQFSRFLRAHEKWLPGDRLGPPPALALLATFSMAAEKMQHTEKMAANNYYGRLNQLLGLGSKEHASESYQAVCDVLWNGLELWLDAWEGERGFPTVVKTKAQPYVNKAISQALLLAADRATFAKIFASAGLEPQQEMDVEDMAGFLAEGMSTYGTAHLKNLWKKPDLQEIIAQAAAGALRAWTGSTEVGRPDKVNIRLVAVIQKVFGRRLDLNIDVLHPDYRSNRTMNLTTAEGSPEPLEFFPSGNRSLRLVEPKVLDARSLIGGRVLLDDPPANVKALRTPRGVVPMRHDETTQVFLEADRMVLGVPHVILARSETAGGGMGGYQLAEDVGQLLAACARPGWTAVDSLPGLPTGWVLFQDVELLAVPNLKDRNLALRVLEPMSSTSVLLSGGVQIPGARRRWSSLRPPLVTVLNDTSAEGGVLTLWDDGAEAPREVFAVTGAADVFDLTDLGLEDGAYRLELKIDDVVRSSQMLLRSSAIPNPRPMAALGYSVSGEPGRLLSAAGLNEVTGDAVIGALVPALDHTGALPECGLPATPWWADAAQVAAARALAEETVESVGLQVTPPDPNSCAVTGAHHMGLPVWTGRVTSQFIKGVCRDCGIVKQYPARPRYRWRNNAQPAAARVRPAPAPQLDLTRINLVPPTTDPNWDVILDVLFHLGSGSASELDRLATQVEGTLLSADRLARGLEALGHLDIKLGDKTMRPERWSASRAALAQCDDRTAVLVGRRSPQLVAELSRIAQSRGASVDIEPNKDLPSSIRVTSSMPLSLDWFDGLADAAMKQTITLVHRPAMALAARLAPISTMVNSLPRVLLPAHRTVESWDSVGTTWVKVDDAKKPGAYRFSGYGVIYGLRHADDITDGTIRLCTVQLLKHIVAQAESKTLLSYQPEQGLLVTRLGADLPGLYGRAAVLCSGLAPLEDLQQRALIYRGVTPDVAALIERAVTT